MALKLKGSTSGFVAIDAPSVAGNNTLILPENTGSAQQLLGNDITAGVVTFTSVTVNRNGDLTVPGTISIGGTLTYEDVTSVDSVGIVTARSGVRINGGGLTIIGDTTGLNATGISTFVDVSERNITVTGVGTFSGGLIHVTSATSPAIRLQDTNNANSDFKIYSPDGDNHLRIYHQNTTSDLVTVTSGGTVGIATISPAGKLDVHGSGSTAIIKARRLDGNGGYNLFEGYSDVNAASIFYVSNNGLGYFKQRINIGTDTEGYPSADNLTVADSGNCGLTLRSGTGNLGTIAFSDATSGSGEYQGYIQYSQDLNYMDFSVDAGSKIALKINAESNVTAVGVVTATQFAATTVSNGRKNLLINGEMKVNQRVGSPGLSYFNPVTAGIYTLDRWKVMNGSSFDTDSAHISKSTLSPDGFTSSMKWDIGNTETPSANQNCGIEQKIEGQNLQHLAYGTSSAKTMTLSFYVYSNKTGTYNVHIMQEDGSKYQMHEYTISSSNTWEKKTIKIVGNTANAINDDNTIGLRIIWVLTVGSSDTVSATSTWASGGDLAGTSNQVNLWDNGNNYWYLTGCQLEVGEIATAYEHLSMGEELALCERYYEKSYDLATRPGTNTTAGSVMFLSNRDPGTAHTMLRFSTRKRAQPTVTAYDPTQADTTGMRNVDDGVTYNYTMNRMGEMGCTAYPTGSINLGKFIQFHYIAESEL